MALVGGTRVDVAQQRDGTTIGVRTDVVVDQYTGLAAEKKTVVAEVPIEGGGTALIAGEQIRAVGVVSVHVQSIEQSCIGSAMMY